MSRMHERTAASCPGIVSLGSLGAAFALAAALYAGPSKALETIKSIVHLPQTISNQIQAVSSNLTPPSVR